MARKSDASGGSWRSPPAGYPGGDPRRYIRLSVDIRGAITEAWHAMPPFFEHLAELLGDHTVELGCLAVRPSAWDSRFEWKQAEHRVRLQMPLSTLADASTWASVLGCIDGDPCEITAFRGGGTSRHCVWALEEGSPAHNINALELHLAVRHVSDKQVGTFRETILQFFNAGCTSSNVVGGYGEAFTAADASGYSFYGDDTGSDRELLNSLIHEEYDLGGNFVAGPRWITLLAPSHLRKLGGLTAFMRRADAWELGINSTGKPLKQVTPKDRLVRIEPVGESAVLILGRIPCTERGVSGCFPRWEMNRTAVWLFEELARANLLMYQQTDRLSRLKAVDDANAAKAVELEREARLRAARESGRLPKKPKTAPTRTINDFRTRPPRCIQGNGTLDKKPPKVRDMNERAVAFRLQPRGLEKALTIYGRASRESEALVSPILVGSLDKDRAALYFDSRIHGFDGEQAPPAPDKARLVGKLKPFACPRCQGRLFDCWAAFEHNDEDGVLSPEDEARRQDFFDWFYLIARCVSCNKASLAADIECA